MKRDLKTAARVLAVPTVAVLTVIPFLPGRIELAVRIYALLLAAVAIGLALSALRRALPPAAPLVPPARRRHPPPVARLGRLEDEVALGIASAFELHQHLRPRVRRTADGLLGSRRGISLAGQPEAARAALGEVAWDLVRPERPAPEDRLARGLSAARMTEVVDSLERI